MRTEGASHHDADRPRDVKARSGSGGGKPSRRAHAAAAPLAALERASGVPMADEPTEAAGALSDRTVRSGIALQGASAALAVVDGAAGLGTGQAAAPSGAGLHRAGGARFAAARAACGAVRLAHCRVPALHEAPPRTLIPAAGSGAVLPTAALALLVALGAREAALDAATAAGRAATRTETGRLAATLAATRASCTFFA